MSLPEKQLEKILSDNTSGSSDLLMKINNLLKKNLSNKNFVELTIKEITKNLSHFSAIKNYSNKLGKIYLHGNEKALQKFLFEFENIELNRYKKIFDNSLPYIKNLNSVLTLSNSNTLLNFFKLWEKQNAKLIVTVCESRPMFEGRILAKNLLKEKIKVRIITDSQISIFIKKVDAVIIGADSVLANGNVINKVGSNILAVLSKVNKKPFYVVASKNKFVKRKTFAPFESKPEEIWNYHHKNLVISNYYFEEIEKKLITKVFSEK